MLGLIMELAHETKYCVEPRIFTKLSQLVRENMAFHATSTNEGEQNLQQIALAGKAGNIAVNLLAKFGTQSSQMMVLDSRTAVDGGEGEDGGDNGETQKVEQFVNIVRLTGPMTRYGGDCSYGSKQICSILKEASDIDGCAAHIIYCHTPGGMASTLRDYRDALNYCRRNGQKVYMYCNGDVASGGAFLACMTDGVYAENPKDEIGSLGMYCAFMTMSDGKENPTTGEVYHEYYASRSTDKNKWYRDAANGDMTAVAESTDRDLEQLLADVKSDRPQVLDEQLSGAMFAMGDVEGSLVDGFMTLGEVAQLALDEFNARKGAPVEEKKGAAKVEFIAKKKDGDGGCQTEGEITNQASAPVAEPQNVTDMYSKIAQAAGLGESLETHEGYVSLSTEQADLLEAALSVEHPTDEQVQSLTAERDQMASRIAELEQAAQETASAHQAEIENLTAAHQTALEEVNGQLATANENLTSANEQIASLTQQVTDRDARIVELEAEPNTQTPEGAPQTNGQGAKQMTYGASAMQYNPSLSPLENAKRREARNAQLKAMMK